VVDYVVSFVEKVSDCGVGRVLRRVRERARNDLHTGEMDLTICQDRNRVVATCCHAINPGTALLGIDFACHAS
jgi:hypothetical protein